MTCHNVENTKTKYTTLWYNATKKGGFETAEKNLERWNYKTLCEEKG
jgi:hypothetical protein